MPDISVSTPHPDYEDQAPYWKIVRDAREGGKAIKEELPDFGTVHDCLYLPRLESQTEDDYRDYQGRALWVNFTSRAHTAWMGLLFRKPIVLESSSKEKLETDVDLRGRSLQDYAEQVGGAVTSVGRAGTLIDMNDEENRPFFAYYATENVINWRYGRIDGRYVLTLLVLREEASEANETDPFTHETVEQFRVYERLPGSPSSVVVTVYQIVDGEAVVIDQLIPVRRGIALTDIPFVFHSACDVRDGSIGPAPLLNIAEINISHYRTSADLENGRHIAGIPTPWASGFNLPDGIKLGAKSALVSDEVGASAGYMEFTGQGLGALADALKEKQEQAALAGARSITPEVGGAEALDTVAMRATAESASLVDVAQTMETQLTQCVRWFEWWGSTESAPLPGTGSSGGTVTFSRDFVAAKITPEQITALVGAVIAGKMSFDAYFHNMQQGEVYAEEWTIEQEREAIEATAAMGLPLPGTQDE